MNRNIKSIVAIILSMIVGITLFPQINKSETRADTAKLVIGSFYCTKEGDVDVPLSHSFVEIYNPNNYDVVLTNNYSLHYMSMAGTTGSYWSKCNLVGTIPAHCSFLINMGKTATTTPVYTITKFDQEFTNHMGVYNKGVKFVLMANQNNISKTVKNPFTGDGNGQLVGYVDMVGVSSNSSKDSSVDGYETNTYMAGNANGQSKQKGFARVNNEGARYIDTDNNLNDFTNIDYRVADALLPRSLSDGAYGSAVNETDPTTNEVNIESGKGKNSSLWGSFVGQIPNNISNTFTNDPKTTRTITWQTGTEYPTGSVFINETEYKATSKLSGGRYYHRVDITGLRPNTTYEYYCGAEGAYSKTYTFKTEGYYTEDNNSFSIIHVTDPQIAAITAQDDSTSWARTINAAENTVDNPSFVLNTGDMVEDMDESIINYYFDYAQDKIASNAFIYSMGNNDDTSWYNKHFITHNNGYGNRSYSFDYKNVHFVNVDSNTAEDTAILNWLENDLKSTDKHWKVFIAHQGAYGRSGNDNGVAKLLDKYNVDLALVGHNHFYCRTYPIDSAGNIKQNGTVWFIPNTAGNKFNATPSNKSWRAKNEQPNLQMFSGVTFEKDRIVIKAYTVNSSGAATEYDSYTITKADDNPAYEEEPNETPMDIVGYQISDIYGGSRIIGYVEPTINGKVVDKWGFIYGLKEVDGKSYLTDENEMLIGSDDPYVTSYESTPLGNCAKIENGSDTANYFTQTMKFGAATRKAYTAKYAIRIYAKMKDGTYIYGDIEHYNVYDIADYIYQHNIMNTEASHNYLYDNILKIVNKDYEIVEYNSGNTLYKPVG